MRGNWIIKNYDYYIFHIICSRLFDYKLLFLYYYKEIFNNPGVIMYYILFYQTIDDYIEKRKPYRDSHLAYARKSFEKGDLILAGALADPADSAVLIFKGDSPNAAESFALNDPYVKNGLIKEWKVRPWAVVIGDSTE